MDEGKSVRRVHRWTGIVFTLCVSANFAAMAIGRPSAWVTYSPLPPLFVLMATGLTLFARPYVRGWTKERADRPHDQAAT